MTLSLISLLNDTIHVNSNKYQSWSDNERANTLSKSSNVQNEKDTI